MNEALDCVAVVDDDALFRELISVVLTASARVRTVSLFASGEELLASLPLAPEPQLLIVDFHMPGLDGAQTIARLKALGVATPIAVISMSADERQQDVCFDAGASWVFRKPMRYEELVAIVEALLKSAHERLAR